MVDKEIVVCIGCHTEDEWDPTLIITPICSRCGDNMVTVPELHDAAGIPIPPWPREAGES